MTELSGRSVGVGITGHQALTSHTRRLVATAIRDALLDIPNLTGVTSLAAGADQIFTEVVLEVGGRIVAVLPSKQYERSFQSAADLATFDKLLKQADSILTMPFDEPSEKAYWSAGQEIVNQADRLLAVWDGQPAAGLGGTADVVRYARAQGKPVTIIWPEGARRN